MNFSERPPLKVPCPHCSCNIALDAEAVAALLEMDGFDCPACGLQVPWPADETGPPETHAFASDLPESGWGTPTPEEMDRSFDSRYQVKRLIGRGGMGNLNKHSPASRRKAQEPGNGMNPTPPMIFSASSPRTTVQIMKGKKDELFPHIH